MSPWRARPTPQSYLCTASGCHQWGVYLFSPRVCQRLHASYLWPRASPNRPERFINIIIFFRCTVRKPCLLKNSEGKQVLRIPNTSVLLLHHSTYSLYMSHRLCETANLSIILNRSAYSLMHSWPLTTGVSKARTSRAVGNPPLAGVALSKCRFQPQSSGNVGFNCMDQLEKYPRIGGCMQFKPTLFKGQLYLFGACIEYLLAALY